MKQRKRPAKKLRFAALLLLAGLLLSAAGCGAKSENAIGMQTAPAAPEPYYDYAVNDSMEYAPDMPKDFGWDMPQTSPSAGASASGGLPSGVKMIYRAYLDLESTQFDQAVAGLDQLVTEMGGYYESSQLNSYSSRRSAQYTVRVPADRYNAFCQRVGALAQVNQQRHTAENVSEQYYDTQSRLETQKAKLERLQQLLAQAADMADLITIESAIADTQWTIDSLTTTLRQYDALIDFSTVEIYLEEVAVLTPQEGLEDTFWTRLARSFRQGTSRSWQNLQLLVLDIAYGWVGWLIAVAAVAAAVIVLRRFFRKRRAKAALKPGFPAAQQPPTSPAGDTGETAEDGEDSDATLQ